MGIKENLETLMYRFDINQETLARIVGVSQPSVSGWMHGAVPSSKSLKSLCDYFNLQPNDILSDEYGLARKTFGKPSFDKLVPKVEPATFMPILGRIHAGTPTDAEIKSAELLALPQTIAYLHPNAYFLQVDGNCMDKVYPDGCFVLIDPDMTPSNGQIAAVVVDGIDYVLRRLYRGKNALILTPDSHDETLEDIVIQGDHQVELVGTAVWFQGEL